MADFGPIYAETDYSRFPVEPWNTASNLIFLAIAIIFYGKCRGKAAQHPALILGLPILVVGFIGGTLFHATRSWNLWLYLDFMPIIILCILASLHFWIRLPVPTFTAPLFVILPPIIIAALRSLFELPRQIAISVGYLGNASMILLPAFLLCRKHGWRHLPLLSGAVISFAVAIFFRISDSNGLLPMGTHFLWHLFGGLSTYLLMEFMYRSDSQA